MKRVTPKEAAELQAAGYTYVDVRTQQEFEAGHPSGAVNVPAFVAGLFGMQPNPEFLGVMQANFAKDAKLVVGCLSSQRSARAGQALQNAGFADVIHAFAGFGGERDMGGRVIEPGWKDAGLPVESGAPAGKGYTDLAARAKK